MSCQVSCFEFFFEIGIFDGIVIIIVWRILSDGLNPGTTPNLGVKKRLIVVFGTPLILLFCRVRKKVQSPGCLCLPWLFWNEPIIPNSSWPVGKIQVGSFRTFVDSLSPSGPNQRPNNLKVLPALWKGNSSSQTCMNELFLISESFCK